MPAFSDKSWDNLQTCHSAIIRWCSELIKTIDFSVREGHRGEEAQEAAFRAGTSKLHYPFSKHNKQPSEAVHLRPYPLEWEKVLTFERFIRDGVPASRRRQFFDSYLTYVRYYYFAGYARSVAGGMGIRVRWGGDWDRDHTFSDQSFHDLEHWEVSI